MTFAMSGQEIESSINKCISEGHTHGMVIGIIKEDGTTFYKGGTLGVNDKRPIDENTVFETGSITKIFTSFKKDCQKRQSKNYVYTRLPQEKLSNKKTQG